VTWHNKIFRVCLRETALSAFRRVFAAANAG
jgi:hypothetical protein